MSGPPTVRALEAAASSPVAADRSARGGAPAVPAGVSNLSPRLLLGLLLVWVLFDRVAASAGQRPGPGGAGGRGLRDRGDARGRDAPLPEADWSRGPRAWPRTPGDPGSARRDGPRSAAAPGVPDLCGVDGDAACHDGGWLRLVPGLFAQAGLAEEMLFRGYLFRHLRAGRSFARAAWAAAGPFAAVHLVLFLTMPWPVALAAVGLAVVLSFPARAPLRAGRPHDLGAGDFALRRAGGHQGRRAGGRGRHSPADHVDDGVRRRPLPGMGLAPADGAPRVTDGWHPRRALASRRWSAPSADRGGSR